MAEMTRYCPDCGWDRLFEQRHAVAGTARIRPMAGVPSGCAPLAAPPC